MYCMSDQSWNISQYMAFNLMKESCFAIFIYTKYNIPRQFHDLYEPNFKS